MSNSNYLSEYIRQSLIDALEPIRVAHITYAETLLSTKYVQETMNDALLPLQKALNQINAPLCEALNSSVQQMAISLAAQSEKQLCAISKSIFSPEFLHTLQNLSNYDSLEKSGQHNSNSKTNVSDYVTVEKSALKEYVLPDTIAVPIGNNKLKMRTEIFLTILSFIITIIIEVYGQLSSNLESARISSDFSVQIEQNALRNQFLQEQNQFLQELVESSDISSSSQSDSIEELREAVQDLSAAVRSLNSSIPVQEESQDFDPEYSDSNLE